jgi:hypothetical protein
MLGHEAVQMNANEEERHKELEELLAHPEIQGEEGSSNYSGSVGW